MPFLLRTTVVLGLGLLSATFLFGLPEPVDSAETAPVPANATLRESAPDSVKPTSTSSTVATETSAQTATGVVFHDANGNERFDDGEKPLAGIRVSNGVEVVKTNAAGRYELPVDDDAILFVVKPRNWRTPLNETNNPRFYYVHKPNGSPETFRFAGVAPTGPLPESVDFPLTPSEEPDAFKAIMFGDPQPRNQQEVDWIAHDVVEELIGTDASFGVTLGDIVFDDLAMFGPQARAIALIGIPWYNVIGNHDINHDAPNDALSDETFEKHFGPAYYSFDHGPVHFLVLDDIEWVVKEGAKRGSYRGGFGPDQIEFIRNDLALVPDDQLVVLLMHIPFDNVNDRQPVYRLIEERKHCISISGHTHTHEHRLIDKGDGWMGPKPHHHIVNVTVSGSWWSGAPDERGIPHTIMRDGGPNGYSILGFDGTRYTLDYKAAGRPADYQMQITTPEVVTAAEAGSVNVYANVFNGSPESKVEMRIDDGDWAAMDHVREPDPRYLATVAFEAAVKDRPWRSLPAPVRSSHLWKAPLPTGMPTGVRRIHVRTTDMWGRTFEDSRSIRVQ